MRSKVWDAIGEDFENLFDPLSTWASWLPSSRLESVSRETVNIYKVDNGFLLSFSKQKGDIEVLFRKVYLTEGELQVGLEEGRLQFDNLIREKGSELKP